MLCVAALHLLRSIWVPCCWPSSRVACTLSSAPAGQYFDGGSRGDEAGGDRFATNRIRLRIWVGLHIQATGRKMF